MEITPGRAMYSPDEELKPLRLPKTYHQQESNTVNSNLSINAAEFVPRFSFVKPLTNVQERLQKHQKQFIQENYQQYQQPQPPQHQYIPQTYSNGYSNQQQQHQSLQSLNTQAGIFHMPSVQDRLHNPNFLGNRGGYQYQTQSNVVQQDYPQSSKYAYNENHYIQHQSHHQDQYHQHRYNSQRSQQQQQQKYHQRHQQQQHMSVSATVEGVNDMENIALDYLQTVIQRLNQNPGQFDNIATRFITIFEGMENSKFVMSNAMEDIFNESIKNPNFRYMGAKLYNLLHMLNPSKNSLFHTLLKLKLKFHQEEVHKYLKNKQEAMVRETALFLAELYMQLRGDDSRIYLIAENIVFSLKQLLSIEDNKDNMRCICLTLKLAGYDLTTDCPEDMKEVITKLDGINCQNPGKYPLLNNVISLQKNNWGRKAAGTESLSESETQKPTEPPRISDDPVLYGPDGHEITAEECEFLTNGAAELAGSSDNDDDNDDVDLDPEMDEETERDFQEFLQQSNNKL